MIRCHNLVDVFFAAKTLRNYKPNMVETLVRSPVPLARPLPTSQSTPDQAPPQIPCPVSGSHSWALGSSPVVRKRHPHFSLSPRPWGREGPDGDSFPPSPRISTTSAMTWPWSTWRGWSQDSRGPWPGAPTARPTIPNGRGRPAPSGKAPEWVLGQPGAPFHCGQGLSARP